MSGRLTNARDRYRFDETSKHQFIELMHGLRTSPFEHAEFMRGSEIGTIERRDGSVTLEARAGVRARSDTLDHRHPLLEGMHCGRYESADADPLSRVFQPGWPQVDVGANIGWYSLHVAVISL